MMNEFEKWQVKWGEKKEILISIGIIPYGYDPGAATRINDVSVDLPDSLIEIICNLVKIKNDLLAACEEIVERTKSGNPNKRLLLDLIQEAAEAAITKAGVK